MRLWPIKKAYAQQIMDYHFARACVAMSNVKKDIILIERFFSVCEFRVFLNACQFQVYISWEWRIASFSLHGFLDRSDLMFVWPQFDLISTRCLLMSVSRSGTLRGAANPKAPWIADANECLVICAVWERGCIFPWRKSPSFSWCLD